MYVECVRLFGCLHSWADPGGRCLVDAAYWTEVDGEVTTHKALSVKIQCLYVLVMVDVVISDQKHIF